ncbi:hypothetical protein SCOR_31370 [Sulfidibacter corallicola]|uniref:Orc1-like AAA ATPase domain-containing protein n=1 Tax=Sulfidibacter corallicola TaxID=2818388 RepID=A0A8A4TIU8_SULCO|nr:hypothetical protein [Sulfidibacter corallicola]QTD49949.1 hypothetical protein J3U87_30575 [Sulfidibacter corallicola]
MTLLLCLLLLQGRQWTWYEHYERGIKHYESARYPECLREMDLALAQAPTPKRNQFTRAVQKIDYKPFYFKALSHYHLGDVAKAQEFAQAAFRGEVVQQSPPLQADLAPIFDAWRRQVQALSAEVAAEHERIRQRRRLLDLLDRGLWRQARDELDELVGGGADGTAFQDIDILIQLRSGLEGRLDGLRDDMQRRIQELIERDALDQARPLLEAFRGDLSEPVYLELDRMLKQAEAQRDSPSDAQDPDSVTRVAEAEAAEAEIQAFKVRLTNLELEKSSLTQRVQVIEQRNRDLQNQLEKERADESPAPVLKPAGIMALSREGELGIRADVVIRGDQPVSAWEIRLDEVPVPFAKDQLRAVDEGYRFNRILLASGYGEHRVSFHLRDVLDQKLELTEVLVLQRPWYNDPLYPAMLLGIGVTLGLVLTVRRQRRRRMAKLRHFNPYIAGAPVRQADMFFGRDALMGRIQGSLHKNSFMIHGDRRIGKTSFLLQLKQNLARLDSPEYAFFPAFVDLQGIVETDLFHHLMVEVVHSAEWEIDTDDLEVHERAEGYQSRHFSKDIKKIIARLDARTDKHVLVVLLVDEVDVLNEFSDKTNQKLRSIFMKDFADHLSCVMAGIHLKKEWESSGSPWYNFFEEIPVAALPDEAARALVLKPVQGIFRYQPDAVDLLLKATAGHPYLIQKLCIKLVDIKLRAGDFSISRLDVEQLLQAQARETRTKES